MPEYDATIDYAMLLLRFAKKNPYLLCSNFEDTVDAYLDMVRKRAGTTVWDFGLTVHTIFPLTQKKSVNEKIYDYYSALEFMLEEREKAVFKLALEKKVVPELGNWIFLTVNFDDKTNINGHIMLSFARKVCEINATAGVPLFTSGIFSLEKNRKDKFGKNYIHHHVHFLLNLTMHLRVSKIVEKIFAVSGIKEFCKKQEFIDVKTPTAKKFENRAQSYQVCEKYVMGLKCDDKAECIGADILWRQSLGLETYYSHN